MNRPTNETITLENGEEVAWNLHHLLGDPSSTDEGEKFDPSAPAHGVYWKKIDERVKAYQKIINLRGPLHGCAACGIRQFENDDFQYRQYSIDDNAVCVYVNFTD